MENRIEENDEWEEREQRAGLESSLEASRPKDARARRRARARLESSPRRDDKTMVISQAGGSHGPHKVNDDKLNPSESSAGRAAQADCLRLPAIPRGQSRSSSLSEPSSTRFSRRSNGESRDAKRKAVFHSSRNFTPRERASKSTDLPSVAPFSLSSVQSRKFGGYRPPSGVILKNLSSGSETESANEASRGLSSARKIGNTVATLELSSPESTAVSSIDGPIKKMPIMSARNDIIGSILPNLLPSSRSLDSDDLEHRFAQNTSRSYNGQANRDEAKACNELGKGSTLMEAIFNERASRDGFAARTSGELRQVGPEDTRYQQQETPRATSTFLAGSFTPETAELATSTYEQIIHNEPATKAYDEFKRIGSVFGDGWQEDCRRATSKVHRDDIRDQFEFNYPAGRPSFAGNSSESNGGVLDEWNRSTGLYAKGAVDTSRFLETMRNDVAEEVLSPEDHSRSFRAAKIYLRKEAFSNGGPRNGVDASDKRDQEIITKVPTLALNSQDISYSTSAGSREGSATRPLDPHALIKALSDVSLKQEKQGEDASRKREGFYRDEDAIDASSRASDLPTKGETWRVPRFSTSPGKSLARVPSKIPVRISSSKTIPLADKFSGCYAAENSGGAANRAESKFAERNGVSGEDVARRRSGANLLYSRTCERDPSSRNKGIEATCAEGAFAPDDETAEFEIDRAPGDSTSSNPRGSRSTLFGDYGFDGTRRLPESKFQGENRPFHREAAYSGGRDYAKIDDDVRSRSDRSTSRKSVDTVDVTSATESPGLSKYRKTESSQTELLRNAGENVTWRTEDECASINDEENDTRNEDYARDRTYPRQNERYEAATERAYDPLRTRRLDRSPEVPKGGRKRHADDDLEFSDDKISLERSLEVTKLAQLEKLTFQVRRTQESCGSAARVSPLNHEPKRRKKKSQERFPFTISEASRALPVEHQDTSDRQSPDQDLRRAKLDDQPREKTVYQLKTHPSVTRLATSGREDTVADILCCVAQEKREDAVSSKSRLKALLRIFSAKLRRAPKQPSDESPELAKIIYENNACQADSKADSSSGSSTGKTRKTCADRWVDLRVAGSKPAHVSPWKALKKTESLQAIAQEHLHRRYDRDDLWVRDIKDSSLEKEDGEISRGKDGANGPAGGPAEDRYSIFLAKSPQSEKPSASNRDGSPKDDVPVSDRTPSGGGGKPSIDRKVPSGCVPEIEEIEEELADCFCWRLCHMIAPSKYRSSMKRGQAPRGPGSLPQARKK